MVKCRNVSNGDVLFGTPQSRDICTYVSSGMVRVKDPAYLHARHTDPAESHVFLASETPSMFPSHVVLESCWTLCAEIRLHLEVIKAYDSSDSTANSP